MIAAEHQPHTVLINYQRKGKKKKKKIEEEKREKTTKNEINIKLAESTFGYRKFVFFK